VHGDADSGTVHGNRGNIAVMQLILGKHHDSCGDNSAGGGSMWIKFVRPVQNHMRTALMSSSITL